NVVAADLAYTLDVHLRPRMFRRRMGSAPLERTRVRIAFAVILAFVAAAHCAEDGQQRHAVILAVGAGGEPAYAEAFSKWAGHWQESCKKAGAQLTVVGLGADE